MNPNTVTKLLRDAKSGENTAKESLFAIVYDELAGVARAIFAHERVGHTLQPTALVHEAWIKVAPHLDQIDDRAHFFAITSRAMRRVLIDHARSTGRQKRGGRLQRVALDSQLCAAPSSDCELVDLCDVLSRLAVLNDRHAQIVDMRILGGLTIKETAKVLGVSHTTIESDWFMAKAWLRTELKKIG